ncbi:DUF342 domain-containing protein [Bacillus timonensis]|uniref:DUF342 domain-containing protein n=1 Tax=Bacillus timonensis TaxID=1033734 RepID=A0A4S3PM75_9BACI|nr:FapA family protein [Bacillus timonensis]THE10610.1 DUF342 domain-containing protein [Bacillus timonensis]
MESIVAKGKDIREAIAIGLNLLETTKDHVAIEIIQNETKGFLGIGSKEGIVKLTKVKNEKLEQSKVNELNESVIDEMELIADNVSNQKETPVEKLGETESVIQEPQMNPASSYDGKVWVKDGHLYCKSSPTHFPMVTVQPGISLYKNGLRVKDTTTIISEQDSYEIRVEDEVKDTKWSVSMDNHRLKVVLEVEPGFKITKKVPDIGANHHIELIAEEVKEIQNTLSYEDVLFKLETLNVRHGFNHTEISKALEAVEPGTFEIVTGILPKPGKDGWVEIKVAIETTEGLQEKEDGSVDFREIKTIPSVERGQLLAVVHPPIPGQIGYTVTNEPLPAKQVHPVVLRTGNGVMVVDDKVVATESGRPFLEKRGQLVKISLMQKLTHLGDVDLASGNLRFSGDIEIVGEVKHGMMVEAEGDIMVHKAVDHATLNASGAVIGYGTIIGSEISAGKNNMLVAELGHLLGIIEQHMTNIVEVIGQLSQSAAFKSSDLTRAGIQPLLKILLERKFKNFPPIAKKYVDVVNRSEGYLQDDEWREIAVLLNKLFLSLTNQITSLESIKLLSRKVKDLHELSKTPVEPDSYITISSSVNSKLYCSGNILILGNGCINTKIHAGGTLKIYGVLRGGEVYGRLGVDINEVGAESGTSTLIAVPEDQKIVMKKVMEGCTIKIGHRKYTFTEARYHVTAYLNDNGTIEIQ